MKQITPYNPKNKIRIVTAASLFDGHDAAINIMRRIIQATGVEVIHLGHDRSVEEVVNTAIQEDANAIAMTSYQGGHNEYFKYMYDLLKEKNASHIKIFGGGGGVILPEEIKMLMDYGITRIYSPDDGREMGLQGMINDLVEKAETAPSIFPKGEEFIVCNKDASKLKEMTSDELSDSLKSKNVNTIARLISLAENEPEIFEKLFKKLNTSSPLGKIEGASPVLGITGTGGAGKSSLVDELVRRFLIDFPEKTIGIISVDPSKRKTGGALLGDRIRMNAINNPRVYMRSLATRQSNLALSKHVSETVQVLKASEFDLIILETSGIGQSDTEIMEHCDVALYVMTPEFGAATQLEKIDMLDFADLVAINKFDKRGALDALRDVKKQYMRNNNLWDIPQDELPVFGTIASQFNDQGMNTLYKEVMEKIVEKTDADLKTSFEISKEMSEKIYVIPPNRTRYLSEIAENNRNYDKTVNEQVEGAQKLYGIFKTICSIAEISEINESSLLQKNGIDQDEILNQSRKRSGQNDKNSVSSSAVENKEFIKLLLAEFDRVKMNLDPYNWEIITQWDEKVNLYKAPVYSFKVRDKEIKIETHTKSLSHTNIPKVALPKYQAWGDILRWSL